MPWLPLAFALWAFLSDAHRDSVKKTDTRTVEITADHHMIQHNYDRSRRVIDHTRGSNEELGVRLQRVIKALKVITSATGVHSRPPLGISEIGLSGPGPVITDDPSDDSRITGGLPEDGSNFSEGLISLTPQDEHAEIHLQPEQIVPQDKALVGLRTDPESISTADAKSKNLGEIHLQPEQIVPHGDALVGLRTDLENNELAKSETKSSPEIQLQPEQIAPHGKALVGFLFDGANNNFVNSNSKSFLEEQVIPHGPSVGLWTDSASKNLVDSESKSLSEIHLQPEKITPLGQAFVGLQTDPEGKDLVESGSNSLSEIHLQPEQIAPQGAALRANAD